MFPCKRDKKGGQPKKPKRGRKANSRPSSSTQETKDANETFLQDNEELIKDLASLRFKEFR